MSAARRLTHLLGASRERHWLTIAQLTPYGAFPTTKACRKYVTRHRDQFIVARRGRVLLVDRDSFDRHVEQRGVRTA
jgi:hypothetical protein